MVVSGGWNLTVVALSCYICGFAFLSGMTVIFHIRPAWHHQDVALHGIFRYGVFLGICLLLLGGLTLRVAVSRRNYFHKYSEKLQFSTHKESSILKAVNRFEIKCVLWVSCFAGLLSIHVGAWLEIRRYSHMLEYLYTDLTKEKLEDDANWWSKNHARMTLEVEDIDSDGNPITKVVEKDVAATTTNQKHIDFYNALSTGFSNRYFDYTCVNEDMDHLVRALKKPANWAFQFDPYAIGHDSSPASANLRGVVDTSMHTDSPA